MGISPEKFRAYPNMIQTWRLVATNFVCLFYFIFYGVAGEPHAYYTHFFSKAIRTASTFELTCNFS
jgi:hypothetical protein